MRCFVAWRNALSCLSDVLIRETREVGLTSCDVLLTTCDVHPATCDVHPVTSDVLFTTCDAHPVTCDVLFCFKTGGCDVHLARKPVLSP